jgi:hypothetical protein
MGLLHKLRTHRQNRRIERVVADFVARPVPTPSQIADYAQSLPREQKREYKLATRRMYRRRWGVMESRTRQILSEQAMGSLMAEQERHEQEDREYHAIPRSDFRGRTRT